MQPAIYAGAIVWATGSGMPRWPARVLSTEEVAAECPALSFSTNPDAALLPVRFFGTHDFARVPLSRVSLFDVLDDPLSTECISSKTAKGQNKRSRHHRQLQGSSHQQAIREASEAWVGQLEA